MCSAYIRVKYFYRGGIKVQDFNDYSKSANEQPTDLLNLVTRLAKQYDGKSQNELIMAIYQEAKKGKKNGTLTNEQIDNFATMLAPFLDNKKRQMLYKIIEELKKI